MLIQTSVIYRPGLMVSMLQHDSALYQVAYLDGQPKQVATFDMVIGSGQKGQSYLYWYNNQVFQLPVSYHTPANKWMNSPGYTPEVVNYNRNIPIGCFQCHSTYINKTGEKAYGNNLYDQFDKNLIMYGIDCERCHGPAAEHVAYHKNNPNQTTSKFITPINNLNRQQQLDMCAVCHSGARDTKNNAFFYHPGDSVARYLKADTSTVDTKNIDVHGKQFQLLTASTCFLKSKTLTCNTCHNVHTTNSNLIDFSAKCTNCHTAVTHSFAGKLSKPITECISCHMPEKPSAVITMTTSKQQKVSAMVRTHYITVYPETTKIVLEKLAKKP